MKDSDPQPIGPPEPPEIARRIQFYRNQKIGLPLIALIPALAVLGVFDSSMTTAGASAEGIQLVVHYPRKVRDRSESPMVITVSNTSAEKQEKVRVEVSRDYIHHFSKVVAEPNFDTIQRNAYVVELLGMAPGEERSVTIDLESKTPGSTSGRVVATDGHSRALVNLRTFTYP